MFVGHYAAALAAKAVEPRAPLWTLVGAAQLVDIAWSGLVMAGVERMSFDTTLPGSPLVLEHMPWTHSLPAAVAWSAGALIVARLFRLPWGAAIAIGLTVFSHWILDFLVHRPDLALWPGGEKVGLGLWNLATFEKTLEMGLIAVAGAAWLWRRGRFERTAWPALLFLGALVAIQSIGELTEPTGTPMAFARLGLVIYLVVVALAFFADLGRNREAA